MTTTPPEDLSGSILDTTKLALNIPLDNTVFDPVIVMHINSVFSDLNTLGIGPDAGFEIVDSTTLWSAYLVGDLNLNQVKTLMGMKVRLVFDPPTTSFHLAAMEELIKKAEWKLNVKREGESWTDPTLSTTV